MSLNVEHILMTADAVGGVWTYCMELAAGLAKHGVRTTLAVMGPEPSAAQRKAAETIPGLTLVVGDYKLEWMDDPWEDVDRAAGWLLQLAERIKPDVVHLNGFCHAALPWTRPTVVVCHSDCLTWWEAVKGEPAPMPQWAEYKRRVTEGLHSASLVVAPTAHMLQEVERIYGPLPSKCVIYNGRNVDECFSGPKRHMIFSAGRFWDEAKNLSLLRQVAPRTQWPIYVAGDAAATTIRTHSLIPLGKVCPNAIHAWYARSAIYALPAKYEPFGLSVLEAGLSGCALVLGDIPTLRELWGEAALFVPTNDPMAWADVLNALAEDQTLRDSLGDAAKNRARTFSAKAMVCNTFFAYQDVRQCSALDVCFYPGVSLL